MMPIMITLWNIGVVQVGKGKDGLPLPLFFLVCSLVIKAVLMSMEL
jgi:hypothetical protein